MLNTLDKMKKLLILFLTMLFGVTLSYAGELTYTPSLGGVDGVAVNGYSSEEIKITFAKGTGSQNPTYYSPALRIYWGNTLEVSAKTDVLISKITFNWSSDSNEISVSTGLYSGNEWNGLASNVTFSFGGSSGHRKLASMTVQYVNANGVDFTYNNVCYTILGIFRKYPTNCLPES